MQKPPPPLRVSPAQPSQPQPGVTQSWVAREGGRSHLDLVGTALAYGVAHVVTTHLVRTVEVVRLLLSPCDQARPEDGTHACEAARRGAEDHRGRVAEVDQGELRGRAVELTEEHLVRVGVSVRVRVRVS